MRKIQSTNTRQSVYHVSEQVFTICPVYTGATVPTIFQIRKEVIHNLPSWIA